MKTCKGVLGIAALGLMLVLLAGCVQSEEKAAVEISPDTTGFDDFMMSAFDGDTYVIVYGSQGAEADTVWLKNYAERTQTMLEYTMKVQIPIRSDMELSEDDIQNSHLIMLGNPEINTLFARVNDQLPIQVIDGSVEVPDAGSTLGMDSEIFTYLVPNPLNPEKYLWVFGAVNSDLFPELQTMTMNIRQEEYIIKAGTRMRYSGNFSKTRESWTIPALSPRDTISEFECAMGDHVFIRYDSLDRLTKERIDEILEKRENCYEEFADRLGFSPEELIEIDIFMTQGIREHYVGRDDDTLFGMSYEVHKDGQEDPAYKEKIAKVFLGSIAVPLDQMLRVGLAVELSSSQIYLLSSIHPEAAMREILEAETYLPLRYLIGARINPDLDAAIVKEELRSFFHYLIEAYGMDKAIALYQTNESQRVEEAMQTVYEKDFFTLEAEWLEAIAQ